MDVFAVPQKSSAKSDSGTPNSNANASAEVLAASFNDILRNADGRLDAGAASLKARVDQTIANRQPEPARRSNDSDYEGRAEMRAERPDSGDQRTDRSGGDEDSDTQRAAIYDEPDHGAGNDPSASDHRQDKASGSAGANGDDRNENRQTEANGVNDAKNADGATDAASAEDSARPAENSVETSASNSIQGNPAEDQATAEFTANALASQLFTNRDVSGPTQGQSSDPSATAGDTRSIATSAIADATGGRANRSGPELRLPTQTNAQMAGNGTGNQTQQQPVGDMAANALDVKSQPTADLSLIDGDAAKAIDGKSQQAAALSRLVGDGNPVSVRAAADAVSDVLVSRPTAALTASAATAAEAAKPTQAGQNAAVNVLAASAAGAEINPMATQAERAAAQATGTQGAAAANASTRGIAQLASTGNAGSGQPQTGGNEGFLGNNTQSANQAGANQQATQTRAPGAPRFTLPQQGAADQVSVQITKALNAGLDRINIQLRPANMGRVDVRMELAADGRVSAVVTADNKDTLEMLQRDSRDLERALQDAGLQTDSGSLSFNLREQNENGREGEAAVAGRATGDADSTEPDQPIEISEFEGGIRPDGRIDIRA